MTLPAYGFTVAGLPFSNPHSLRFPSGTRGSLTVSLAPGNVATSPPTWVRAGAGSAEIGWARYATYHVRREPASVMATVGEAPEVDAAFCLAMSVLPLTLPLFDLEPLHASAVAIDGGALLFLGASGRGKSALAAELLGHGAAFVTDDAAAFDADGKVWPAPPLLGLRQHLAVGAVPGPRLGRYGDKIVIVPDRAATDPLEVACALILEPAPGAPLALRAVRGRDRFAALLAHARSPQLFTEQRRPLQLRVLTRLATAVPVAVLSFDPAVHPPADTAAVAQAGLGEPLTTT